MAQKILSHGHSGDPSRKAKLLERRRGVFGAKVWGFRVLGFRVWDLGCRVYGLGLGFRLRVLRFRVPCGRNEDGDNVFATDTH